MKTQAIPQIEVSWDRFKMSFLAIKIPHNSNIQRTTLGIDREPNKTPEKSFFKSNTWPSACVRMKLTRQRERERQRQERGRDGNGDRDA